MLLCLKPRLHGFNEKLRVFGIIKSPSNSWTIWLEQYLHVEPVVKHFVRGRVELWEYGSHIKAWLYQGEHRRVSASAVIQRSTQRHHQPGVYSIFSTDTFV